MGYVEIQSHTEIAAHIFHDVVARCFNICIPWPEFSHYEGMSEISMPWVRTGSPDLTITKFFDNTVHIRLFSLNERAYSVTKHSTKWQTQCHSLVTVLSSADASASSHSGRQPRPSNQCRHRKLYKSIVECFSMLLHMYWYWCARMISAFSRVNP